MSTGYYTGTVFQWFVDGFLRRIPVIHGQNSTVDTKNGSSELLDTTSQSPINDNVTRFKFQEDPRIFKLWVKPFHWNFMQYLLAYLQWHNYLDGTDIPEHCKDEKVLLVGKLEIGQAE